MQTHDVTLLRANGYIHAATDTPVDGEASTPNYWLFNERLNRRLFVIHGANVVVGLLLSPFGAFWRGFGSQNIGWGAISLGIGVVGRWQGERKFMSLQNPYAAEVMAKEARNLRRILAVNVPLNFVYMLGGYRLLRRAAGDDAGAQRQRGMGWGIIAQGVLLLCFDTFHVLRVPRVKTTDVE